MSQPITMLEDCKTSDEFNKSWGHTLVPEKLWRRLRLLAAHRGTYMSAIIVDAIRDYLNREEKVEEMKLLFSDDWLRRTIASDPDVDAEAGPPL